MALVYDLNLARSLRLSDGPAKEVLQRLDAGISAVRGEMDTFRDNAARFDKLYFPNDITMWGSDTWADDPSATTPGRAHISVNTSPVYVDLPATLQAVEPVENMLATGTTDRERSAAADLERLYEAWKLDQDFELLFHKACYVKGLYGRTAGRYYWDEDKKKVCVNIIERPQRLWLGYQADTYNSLEWAAFQMRMTPNAVAKAYGVSVTSTSLDGSMVPVVASGAGLGSSDDRPYLTTQFADGQRIDVWDFWYREWEDDKLVTKNAVLAGNALVRDVESYPDYDGEIPYLPLFNGYVPNTANGRPDLYDVEQLIHEAQERLTSGSQMIASGTAGDYWQLVGPDAPTRIPATLQPKRNEIVGPGPGNRIETITPFIAQFQLESHLKRIDYEKESITGINDLLLGHVPGAALGSSRAVNAFYAQYELRMKMRRMMLYSWRRHLWERVLKVWAKHDSKVADIVKRGGGVLDIQAPALSPRDELDTATKAMNLTGAGLWSGRRGMDAVGVDDPETEQQMIREEQTDATLNPAKVQVMAQLLATFQSLGQQAPQPAQDQAGRAQSDLRNALGAATPTNDQSMQAPGETGQAPPGANQPGATPPGAPFAQGPAGKPPVIQNMVQNGKASGRILSQVDLGRKP